MHFIDRDEFTEAPTAKLDEFSVKKKAAWAAYNTARMNSRKSSLKKPPALWLDDAVRNPLKKLFLKNCGYCGIHADQGRDAEVDHFHPTSKDATADLVFDWTNYIWSCPSCNGLKGNEHPFLNPTSNDDVKHLYFHSTDGRYLLYSNAPTSIYEKFQLTENKSNLNSKNRPPKRKFIFKVTNRILDEIRLSNIMYLAECAISGGKSPESQKKLKDLESKKADYLDLIRSGDHLFLIKYLTDNICNDKDFPYSFDVLLKESNYLS